jgi:hypothetical protein
MKSFFLLLLCMPIIAFSQGGYLPGYIIMNNGDSLHGLVKHINALPYQVLVREVKFRDEQTGKKSEFTPEQVKEFRTEEDTTRFIPLAVMGDTSMDFVAVMAEGYLNYYQLQETTGPGRSNHYEIFQKKNDSLQFWYTAGDIFFGFKKKITQYLSDDPALCAKIMNGTYKEKQILDIVKEYNSFHAGVQ